MVVAMRDDRDNTRSIMGRLQGDLGSNVNDKAGEAGAPRRRGEASSGQGATERRV